MDSSFLRMPLFGRTQYRFGAVVFTLKAILSSVGFIKVIEDVTTSVNGPVGSKNSIKITELSVGRDHQFVLKAFQVIRYHNHMYKKLFTQFTAIIKLMEAHQQ